MSEHKEKRRSRRLQALQPEAGDFAPKPARKPQGFRCGSCEQPSYASCFSWTPQNDAAEQTTGNDILRALADAYKEDSTQLPVPGEKAKEHKSVSDGQ